MAFRLSDLVSAIHLMAPGTWHTDDSDCDGGGEGNLYCRIRCNGKDKGVHWGGQALLLAEHRAMSQPCPHFTYKRTLQTMRCTHLRTWTLATGYSLVQMWGSECVRWVQEVCPAVSRAHLIWLSLSLMHYQGTQSLLKVTSASLTASDFPWGMGEKSWYNLSQEVREAACLAFLYFFFCSASSNNEGHSVHKQHLGHEFSCPNCWNWLSFHCQVGQIFIRARSNQVKLWLILGGSPT